MKVKSQLIDAQLEARNSDPTKRGEIVYHTGDDEVKVGDGSGTKSLVTKDDSQTLTNKTLTAPVLNGALSGTGVLDEDNMASNSDTAVPTQQSVKAYVDAQVAGKDEADEISYSNSTSGLTATDVQAAIDEVDGDLDTHVAASSAHGVSGSVVGTTDTQDLSNKTITDALTLEEQGSTPSTPASGDKKLYAKNDGKLYTLDDAGIEQEVGSGGGGGSKNYIDNGDFETDTSGWSTDDGAASASGVITLSRNTTTPLSGSGDLSFAKSAADGDGHFAKVTTETIDRSDRGKILFFSCNFDADDANYANNLEFEFYDNTNSAVLYAGPASEREILKTQGKVTLPVYTESTTASIEVRIKINDTDATAYTVYFDDFKLGPAAQVQTVYRKSQTIDLTGSGDFTGGEIQVERVGNVVTISETATATFASATIPESAAGLIPDWALPATFKNNLYSLSSGLVTEVFVQTDGKLRFEFRDWAGSTSAQTSALQFGITYTVPDTAGPTLTENELSLQTVGASVYDSAAQSIPNSTVTDITFDTVVEDDFSMYNSSTGEFTMLRAGRILATGSVRYANNSAGFRGLAIKKNGTIVNAGPLHEAHSSTNRIQTSKEIKVSRGDTIEFAAFQTSGGALNTTGGESDTFASVRFFEDYTVLGAVKERNRVQKKFLSANTTSEAVISDISFSNLVIGKWYTINVQITYLGGESYGSFDLNHDGSTIARLWNKVTSGGNGDRWTGQMSVTFKATATTVEVDAADLDGGAVEGNGTGNETWAQLEERNDLIETSDFG
jgi:hypothetical protein